MTGSALPHAPVMLQEMLQTLKPAPGETYIDGTFGAGGYSKAILQSAENTKLFAIDQDPRAKEFAALIEQEFPSRFILLEGRFSEMEQLLARHGITQVNGIVLDIGVSSMQLDDPSRGFSFRYDGPLDMRMGQHGMTAADFVNSAEEEELADVIYNFGEEKAARRIARAIVAQRAANPFTTTAQLANLVRTIVHASGKGIDPATRTFQALRIHINDELGELEMALEAAERLLMPGGRLVVLTFHSLEDRIVKQFFLTRSGNQPGLSRHIPVTGQKTAPTFTLPQRKHLAPTEEECKRNARARSAKLRVAVRTQTPAPTSRRFI